MAASSGIPSARYALSFLISTIGSFSTLTSPYTFFAITDGSPTVSNCFRQANCGYMLIYDARDVFFIIWNIISIYNGWICYY